MVEVREVNLRRKTVFPIRYSDQPSATSRGRPVNVIEWTWDLAESQIW